MKATTPKFKQIMASGNARDYVIKVDLTLADDPTIPTILHLDESDIWNDSFSIETASSGTSSFDIGTAVIGQCKFSLNNFDERFNQYDFFNASAVVWVGLKGDTDNNDHQVYYRMGFFTVDEPTYAGALIQLVLLDNMWKFDIPLSDVNLSYPITALNALLSICSYCGVILDQTSQFHGYDFLISEAPEGIDNMNCRDFIQYVAMIGCNFCIITPEGKLKLRWYDVSAIPTSAQIASGTFDPDVDDFSRNFDLKKGTDLISITGVKFIINNTEHTIGSSGYMLELDNPLVNDNNVNSVLNLIWDVLENFDLRIFSLTTTSNLAVEVGDCCVVKDYKGRYAYSWVTLNTFKFAAHQVQCNAIPPTRTLTKQFSKVVQAAVAEARIAAGKVVSNYDLAVQMMNSLAVNAMGGYEDYEDLGTGGRVWYLSNMPITKNPTTGVCSFETGSIVYKKSGSGFFVSRDGGQTWVNGYDMSTGELVVNVLDAIGINAEWIRTGTLTVGGRTSGTQHPTIEVYDASDNLIVEIDRNGITMHQGIISSPDYAEVSGATYSTTGMKLDVLNKILRSPYFAIDTNGAYFKGTILITGDFEIRSSRFIPAEYGIADDFAIELAAPEGYSESCSYEIKMETNTSTIVVASGTITSDTPIVISQLDPLITEPSGYYELTISDSSVKAYIHEATLAYVGQEGFKGRLQGIVEGSLYSDYGHIGGISYGADWEGKHILTGEFVYPSMYGDPCRVLDFANASFYIGDSNGSNVVSNISLTDDGIIGLSGVGDNDDTIVRIYERGNLGCNVFIKKGSNGGVITRRYDNPQQPGHYLENSVLWDSDIQTSQQDSPPSSLADGHLFLVYE